MTAPTPLTVIETVLDDMAEKTGRIAICVTPEGQLDPAARRLNRLSKGAIARATEAQTWQDAPEGTVTSLAYPAGLAAEAIDILKISKRAKQALARKSGAALATRRGAADLTICAGNTRHAAEIAFGVVMKDYTFDDHKTSAKPREGSVTLMASKADEVAEAFAPLQAVAEGAFFTRDLVNAPANVLTTTTFADQLAALADLGLEVEVLEEDALEALGMRTLLSVGQGSASPSKVVVMSWNGGGAEKPLALIGKGVVFDTGGISLKPAAGMEDMTMDMGGAGTVAGVMKTLALRKAKANVVGLVGLVENMPSSKATRPGDVVASMKGDTVEIINTDAEGRLVLCDVMWYAQDRFEPVGMIDLATLTGAIIIGLGHENAGVFSNDDALCDAFLKAAASEGEGAWRMPLGQAYDDLLKSRIADMKNVGGRAAGSVTAAQFLQRFVKDGTPWIHLDIAGVASVKSDTTLAPKGATGWGVAALNRLVADQYES
jgi:leucyl aminopeptidase